MFTTIRAVIAATTLFSCMNVSGQPGLLRAGEKMPNLHFNAVINSPNSELKVSDFKSKFLILEFWNPACTACIKSFPVIDSLQERFNGVVQFVLVNKESRDSTKRFLAKRKKLTPPSVPMITNAQKLVSMLPKEGFPYSVWIDSSLIIRYITPGYNVTGDHVASFIANRKIDMKADGEPIFRGNLFAYCGNKPAPPIGYYCYISKCIEGLDIGNSRLTKVDDSSIRLSANCRTIVDLYMMAYSEHRRYKFNTPASLELHVADSSQYVRPTSKDQFDQWQRENTYNFDLVLPLAQKNQAYKIMQQQLAFYFGLTAAVVQRAIDGKVVDVLKLQE